MTPESTFTDILIKDRPQAIAWITGSDSAPELNGRVKFYNTPYGGILVEAQVFGLPKQNIPNTNSSNPSNSNMNNPGMNNSNMMNNSSMKNSNIMNNPSMNNPAMNNSNTSNPDMSNNTSNNMNMSLNPYIPNNFDINNSNNNFRSNVSSSNFHAMHIHEHGDCTIPFNRTGDHYNPTMQMHPYHAGDMVPLLENDGFAYQVFYDKRFSIDDIIGKSVIIHSKMDDFMTQPSGNSGNKIGCGVIRRL